MVSQIAPSDSAKVQSAAAASFEHTVEEFAMKVDDRHISEEIEFFATPACNREEYDNSDEQKEMI